VLIERFSIGTAGTNPALLLAVALSPCVVVYPIEVAEAVPLSVVHSAPPVQAVLQVIGPVVHLAPVGPPGNLAEVANSVTLPVLVSGAMVSMSSVLAIREWKKSFSEIRLIHPSNTLG
jgi:hypothetical protein